MRSYLPEVRDKADLEIREAFLYYETKSTGLGEKFLQQVENLLKRLCVNPEQFPRKHPSYREAVLKKFPFGIVYKIQDDHIIVLSVFNTWLDPEKKPG